MAQQQVLLPPPVVGEWTPMTFEEFVAWAPENTKAEWVDGRGTVYVSNDVRHARLVQFLSYLFDHGPHRIGENGVVVSDTVIVRIPGLRVGRMPDVAVVLGRNLHRLREGWIDGPPDLLVEILSKESLDRDLTRKRDDYAAAGVPEYLVVDGRDGRDEFHYLWLDASGRYQRIEPDELGRYHSKVIPGLMIDPEWIKRNPVPRAAAVIQELAGESEVDARTFDRAK